MCMTCIHISLLSSQCFSVLNSNDSHKRFLSKGFYILFPPLSLSFALYCFEYFCLICDCLMVCVSDVYERINERLCSGLWCKYFSFLSFFVRSYFNITKTLIIKISMLCFLIVRYF